MKTLARKRVGKPFVAAMDVSGKWYLAQFVNSFGVNLCIFGYLCARDRPYVWYT
jgi:hypothetical protein